VPDYAVRRILASGGKGRAASKENLAAASLQQIAVVEVEAALKQLVGDDELEAL
jgi:hypothetical protein